jgi:hypothetical protein
MQRWATSASAFADLLETAAEAMRSSPLRDHCTLRLPRRGRLLATGDIHDNQLHLDAVVRAARLSRSADNHADNHVVLHELIHGDRLVSGMDMSHRMLAKVAELVIAHPLQVHPILANHEIAQYRRQHISKGAGDNLQLFDAGLEWVFGDEAEVAADAIGAFVRAMPLALRCENGTMVSHSLPSAAQMPYFDPGVFGRDLVEEDFDGPSGAAYIMTWGRNHPPEHLESLARAWGVKLFIVGHSHASEGIDFRPPNLVILNTDHSQGRVLEIDLAEDAPDAASLVGRAIPVQSYFDLDSLSGGEGRHA